jgi:DNA-binding transcriptional LysR family regulator
MGDFLALYPDISVQLVLSDEETDLARREADCAIRFHAPHQSDLIRRALAPVHYRICASSAYLEKHGEPAILSDLAQHRIVAYGPRAPALIRGVNWLVEGDRMGAHPPVLTINNIFGILQAVETGVGIAVLPSYLIQFSRLVRVILPDAPAPMFRTYFCYPSELRRSLRIGALRDFVSERMTVDRLNPDTLPHALGA